MRPPTPLERGAERVGTPLLATAVASALERLRRSGRSAESILKDRHLLDERETALVAAAIYDVRVLADLAGRQKALRQVDLARERALQARITRARKQSPWLLADDPEDELSEDSIWKMQPEKAIRYFEDLRPGQQLPRDWSTTHRRQAFEMAVTSDQTLLDRVHGLIEDRLKSGKGYDFRFDQELDDLGLGHANPSYGQMVFRTNTMDAYNTGGWDAVAGDADIADEFPYWEYLAIEDDRIRDAHAEHLTGGINGTAYYPADQTFDEVRGTDIGDVANCRCTFRWIHKYEAAELGLPVAEGALAFDPDQPRDEQGQWSEAGGGTTSQLSGIAQDIPPLAGKERMQRLGKFTRGEPLSREDVGILLFNMQTAAHYTTERSAAKDRIENDVLGWAREKGWTYGVRQARELKSWEIPGLARTSVLYVDSPAGQLSFHVSDAKAHGLPTYVKPWDEMRGATWKRLNVLYGGKWPV